MKGMILAAGFGTRLKPLTDHIPKPLLPFVNQPLITYSISFLKEQGIKDIIINVHHLGREIIKYVGNGEQFGVSVSYSEEAVILGTGGGIKKAKKFLKDDDCIVINSDFLCAADLRETISFHKEKKATATMVIRESDDMAGYGIIGVDSNNRIKQFTSLVDDDKQAVVKKGHFTGIHIFSPEIFDYLDRIPHDFFCINRTVYPKLIKEERAFGFCLDGQWVDVGTFHEYFTAQLNSLEGGAFFRFPGSEKIMTGKGTVVETGTVIDAPAVIGKQCVLKSKTHIAPYTILGHNCVIETGSHLSESIVLDCSNIPPHSTLHRKIVCGGLTLDG